MTWAISIFLLFTLSAFAEDHSAPLVVSPPSPTKNRVINVAPPGVAKEDLEVIGSIDVDVEADPDWVDRTVEDIRRRFGDQSPETLEALESALSDLAVGQEPAEGFAGDIARQLVEEGTSVEQRILGRPSTRSQTFSTPVVKSALPVIPPTNKATKILQKTDELSYKSPRLVRALAPPSLLGTFGVGAETLEGDLPEVGSVVAPPKVERKRQVVGKYQSGGLSADAATEPVSSNNGVTVSTGGGVLNLVPAPSGNKGTSQTKGIAGALFRAMRGAKVAGVVSGEVSPHGSRPTPLLNEGAMEQLQDWFEAPTATRAARAARTIAQVAVRPPSLNRQQLWVYYGAMAVAWMGTLAYLFYCLRRFAWKPNFFGRKAVEESSEEKAA